jgi:hypothetical protein
MPLLDRVIFTGNSGSNSWNSLALRPHEFLHPTTIWLHSRPNGRAEKKQEPTQLSVPARLIHNSGGRIRTSDLRVMGPTSYQTALPRGQQIEFYTLPAVIGSTHLPTSVYSDGNFIRPGRRVCKRLLMKNADHSRFLRIFAAISSIRPLPYLYDGHPVRTRSPALLGMT